MKTKVIMSIVVVSFILCVCGCTEVATVPAGAIKNAAVAMGTGTKTAAVAMGNGLVAANPVKLYSDISEANKEKERLAKEKQAADIRYMTGEVVGKMMATLQDKNIPSEIKDSVCHHTHHTGLEAEECARLHALDVDQINRIQKYWDPPVYRAVWSRDRKTPAEWAYVKDPANREGPYEGPELQEHKERMGVK